MSATKFSRLRQTIGNGTSTATGGDTTTQLTETTLGVNTNALNGGDSIGGSSESSDPVESDYSDEEEDCEPNDDDNDVNDDEHYVDANNDDNKDENVDENHIRHHENVTNTIINNDSNSEANHNNDQEEVDDGNETDENETESVKTNKGQGQGQGQGQGPFHLDDFQIIKTVGTGTFGRVCLCKDKRNNKFCAMKILAMTDVIRLKQVEHVKNEKNILQEISHPFVVNLLWSTKDDCCLYMLFEYICGGELFSYLRNSGRISSSAAIFYASEIVLALEYLHSLSIVYRDLKPENLLINSDGHLKITDFGFAKKLRDRTWTLCGTPEYLAPEIIQSKGHNRAVDWWALGVLIYEMLVGYPPFYDDNPFGIYEKILSGKIEWPRQMDPIAKDLVKKLLVLDRTKRLGNMKNGADDVKRHRWFKHLNWTDVFNKKMTPPILPKITGEGDTSNFDEYPETDWKPARALSPFDMQLFKDF